MFKLREYQTHDVAEVLKAHAAHRAVLGRAATGLGKAVEVAELARHYSQTGRVMVLVDVGKLVLQLADTIAAHIGMRPGVEMAESYASNGNFMMAADPVVVSTVQSQYSGAAGAERYRQFNPRDFSALILDECETFLAPKAREVVDWYMANPDLKVYGCSATPFRTDGTPMADLFSAVAFDRDIVWGIENGFLVPARQAFVHVSLDFSTLKVRKNEQGERDYSDDEIAELVNNEQTLIELAKGILHVAEDRKSIVVCPNVATAKAVAHYLDAEKSGCARAIYGELGDQEKADIFERHQAGDFQFLSSVMMLTKGYDDKAIRAVFNLRKTRSKRLYQQILGRGTRPLSGVVDGPETAGDRRAAIAASRKPDMLMVNMVGVDDAVRDITLVDILGEASGDDVRERAKRIMQESEEPLETADALAEAEEQVAREAEEKRRADEEEEKKKRRRVQVDAHVAVEYVDDLRVGGGGVNRVPIPDRQLVVLRKAKVPDQVIARLGPAGCKDLSREIVRRWKKGLCSYKQATLLRSRGYSKEQLHDMSYEAASAEISRIAEREGWRKGGAA